MKHQAIPTSAMLPHTVPPCADTRLLLYGIRRMAAGGLRDAHAANAFLGGFGIGFRRPLVLLRAFMAETQRISATRVLVAPCCCARMTGDEQVLLGVIAGAIDAPEAAHRALCRVLKVRGALGLVTSAQAVGASFADLGKPLALEAFG